MNALNSLQILLSTGFCFVPVGAASAQSAITVSKSTNGGVDIVTMRYKESGSFETKSLEVDVTIPKDTSAEKKAELIEAAIDAQNNPNVKTDISGTKKSKINITGGNGATIKSADISGASGEARDTSACDDSVTCEFTCT